MSSTEPGSAGTPTPSQEGAQRKPGRDARVGWAVPIVAATLAGAVAWGGGEWVERANTVRLVTEFEVPGSQQLAQRRASITTRSTLAYGLLGASLGTALGAAGGWARRSMRSTAKGVATGLVAGAVGGALAARLVVPMFLRNENTTVSDDLILPLVTHGSIWSSIGAAGGLALGVGLGGPPRRVIEATLGGLLGGLVATTVYELVGGIAFPFDHTGQPISEGIASRLFARLVLTTCVAIGAILSLRRSHSAQGA